MAPRSPGTPRSTAQEPAPARRRRADPAPSAANRYLLESERLVFAVRRHSAVMAGAISLYLAVLFVAFLLLWFADGSGAIATTGLVVLLVGTVWFGWKLGDWWVERFTVTDRRVLLVSGLLTRRVAIMPLRKVTDLTFERSFVGRLFGYGAFVMESAGQQQALSRIDFLPRPESLYLQMSDLLFGRGGNDVDPDEDGPDLPGAGRGAAASPTTRPGTRRSTRPAARSVDEPDRRSAARPVRVVPRPHDTRVVPPPPGPQVRSPGSPRSPASPGSPRPPRPAARPAVGQVPAAGPATSATTPLPAIARESPVARRPRGRGDLDDRA